MINIKRMIIDSCFSNIINIRFKYYGDFETIKLIYDDCKDNLSYIGNSNIDASPIFIYKIKDIDIKLFEDFKSLNVYLRNLKLRKITKNDLTYNEKSILSFLIFFMYNIENNYIKGVSNFEINYISISS